MNKIVWYIICLSALLLLISFGCKDLNRISGPEDIAAIKSIKPASAPFGGKVVISGFGFGEAGTEQKVFFNETLSEIELSSDTMITTRVPVGSSSGPIMIITAADTLVGPSFTVDTTRNIFLNITSIEPERGITGTEVEINGSGFGSDPEAIQVLFNSLSADINNVSDNQIRTTVPSGAETGPISVIVNQETVQSEEFTVVALEVNTITPESGPAGTIVTISGQGFSQEASENNVTFNGVVAEVNASNFNEIQAVVPADATSGEVSVTVYEQTVNGPVFTVENDKPGITSVEPSSGRVGEPVTINGVNFSTVPVENIITFNGVNAVLSSATETQLTTTVPQGATDGPVAVTVNGETVTGPEFDVIIIDRLVVEPASVSILISESINLTATVYDDENRVVDDASITWTSENTAIATVDAAGTVTGVAEGNVIITATGEGVSGTAEVTVTAEETSPERIEVTPDPVTVRVEKFVQMTATVFDADNNVIDATVSWSIGDTEIATVDEEGEVRGWDVGQTIVTATSGSITGTATVNVEPGEPEIIELTPDPAVVKSGESVTMSATIKDEADNVVPGAEVDTWFIDDESIATVDANGVVTGERVGETFVAAISGTAEGFATVIVEPGDPDFISVEPDPATVQVGKTVTMTATVFDASENELPDATVSWSVENTSIASIDANGVLTGENTGQTTVTATSGSATGTAIVNVEPGDPARITVTPDPATVQTGETVQMSATVFDEAENELPDATVTWSIDNTAIATVDGNGLVTGVSAGETFVTAASGSATGTAVVIVDENASEVIFDSISAGSAYGCALDLSGNAYCWGNNGAGNLGIGDTNGITSDKNVPTAVIMPTGVSFTSISTGRNHTLALSSDGRVYAWGSNGDGQLGDGTQSNRSTPILTNIPSEVTIVAISAGFEHSLALSASGQAYAWGTDGFGQLGIGRTEFTRNSRELNPIEVVMPIGVTFTHISAGFGHSLALDASGQAYAWGLNDDGQLGNSSTTRSSLPVEVDMPAGVTFSDVSTGAESFHSIALSSDGMAYAWGENSVGQLGNGTFSSDPNPVPISVNMPDGVSFVDINDAGLHVLALSSTGQAYAWGFNREGQLGDGTNTNRTTPVQVSMPDGVVFESISASGESFFGGLSLAIDISGQAWSWGKNLNGQLGDGSTNDSNIPVMVTMPESQ